MKNTRALFASSLLNPWRPSPRIPTPLPHHAVRILLLSMERWDPHSRTHTLIHLHSWSFLLNLTLKWICCYILGFILSIFVLVHDKWPKRMDLLGNCLLSVFFFFFSVVPVLLHNSSNIISPVGHIVLLLNFAVVGTNTILLQSLAQPVTSYSPSTSAPLPFYDWRSIWYEIVLGVYLTSGPETFQRLLSFLSYTLQFVGNMESKNA